MAESKDANGYTTIATESDGVYLTVFPPTGKGKRVTVENVKIELAKYNISADSEVVLQQAVVQANGKKQKISGSQEQVFVEIAPDAMSAKVTILPPANPGEKFMAVDDVRAALIRRNVVYGIDENRMADISAKLSRFAAEKNIAESVEGDIAFGTPVVNGEDARIEYLYKKEMAAEPQAAAPEQTEDGRIDYRAAHKIDNIAKGTVLARKIHATKGTSGKTVMGVEVQSTEGKDVTLTPQKGVIVSPENPDEFIADADGQVIIKEGKISVLALYEVPGDVNLSTGNIDFIGTVIVKGDVKDGFKVYAGEDIVVNGVVEGAELKAGGKMTILGGVSGNDKAHIICKGDANIKYIRNAIAEVGGNLTITQAIMHSKITVDGKVNVSGQKGTIVGGQVIAGQEVSAALIGSNFATPTEIIVGEVVGLRAELQRIEAEIKAVAENADKTKKGLMFLKEMHTKLGGNLPNDKKELLTKLTRAQFKLVADSKILLERKQELEKKEQDALAERRLAKVMCTGVIHTGVKIIINKVMRQISEELKYCTLTESGGEVRVGPLKG